MRGFVGNVERSGPWPLLLLHTISIDSGRRVNKRVNNWVEISGSRLAENFGAVRAAIGADAEAVAVIKADAYGHGALICAPILTQSGARWLGVTDAEEGAAVRRELAEDATRLMVMSGMQLSDAGSLIANGLTPVVWTAEHVSAMECAARAAGQRVPVHVEIDTGMARQGAAVGEDLQRVLKGLAASRWVSCEGVMTHLCCSEVSGAMATALAQQRFADALTAVAAAGLQPDFVHLGNTSAVDEGSTSPWVRDKARTVGARAMARTGLALYGHCLPLTPATGESATRPAQLCPNLKPVMTWKANVLDVREVEAGTTVGYGATFVAKHRMRLALIPVGYADGFRREASSGVGDGWVMLKGQRAAVVGRVSMNLMVVDITAIEGVVQGTETVLLGEGISAEDHARWAKTIPYEILCGIRGSRVLR